MLLAGSPFHIKVSGAPDASKVKVKGPGIEHGILATYRSHFICETRGAGAGQLTVRVRGPKGEGQLQPVTADVTHSRTVVKLLANVLYLMTACMKYEKIKLKQHSS